MTLTDSATALEEIRTLQARYWRLMDTKQWSALEDLFAPDARMSFPGDRGGEAAGARACVDFIRERVGTARTVHHGHMPEITFESSAEASGVWAMEDIVEWPEGEPFRGMAKIHGWGHYHNRYVRTDDGWRIALTRVTRLRLEETTA